MTATTTTMTTTGLSFTSDAGDYIGQGESHQYKLADATWLARYDSFNGVQHVYVSMTNFSASPSYWWYLDFSAPKGQTLKPGVYEAARRYPFQPDTQPGLSFSGTGRGCNMLTGRFTVIDFALGPGDTVDRFQATFEQNCEGASPALRGQVAVFANPWR